LYKLYKLLIYKLSHYSLDIAKDCGNLSFTVFNKNGSLASLVFMYLLYSYILFKLFHNFIINIIL